MDDSIPLIVRLQSLFEKRYLLLAWIWRAKDVYVPVLIPTLKQSCFPVWSCSLYQYNLNVYAERKANPKSAFLFDIPFVKQDHGCNIL